MNMKEVTIRLSEADYRSAEERSRGQGVEAYIQHLVTAEIRTKEPEDFDHIFTPEYLDQLHAAAAEIAAGKGLTPEQMDDHFRSKRSKWLETRGV